MKKQFEYKPFDRVTVDYNGAKMPGAVMCDLPDNWFTVCYESKAHRYLTNPFCADQIRPGNYDADGNWLPQPGEPCFYIDSEGKAVQAMVFSADSDFVTTVSAIGLWRDYYKVFGGKAIVAPFWSYEDIGQDIPQSAILHPGRIKAAE